LLRVYYFALNFEFWLYCDKSTRKSKEGVLLWKHPAFFILVLDYVGVVILRAINQGARPSAADAMISCSCDENPTRI
jgi:hypothetical protein